MKYATVTMMVVTLARCAAASEFVSLLQSHVHFQADGDGGCSTLKNHGSYFSTGVEAGDEAQQLDLVVDTGSDEVVVPSCTCSKCKGKCLRQLVPSNAAKVKISYGSGDIEAVVMSGPLKVGSVFADMHESMLVMTSNELSLVGAFEGILALGPPHSGRSKLLLLPDESKAFAARKPHSHDDYFYTKSFLEEASITRFSLCFKRGSTGALRLGSDVNSGGEELGSVGDLHWGLGLTGVSVGSAGGHALACNPGSEGGSASPCGAIPDSGTTLLMGPASQISALYAAICLDWPVCKSAAKKDEEEGSGEVLLASTFEELVDACQDLDSLPPLFFHLTGAGGSSTTVSIPGASYIYHDSGDCVPAFEETDYNTEKNGPIWILGLPLFMEYTVTYDVGKTPPTMSFNSGGCATCSGSLLRSDEGNEEHLQWQISRKEEPLRKRKIDETFSSLFRNNEDNEEHLQWQISRKEEPLRKRKINETIPL